MLPALSAIPGTATYARPDFRSRRLLNPPPAEPLHGQFALRRHTRVPHRAEQLARRQAGIVHDQLQIVPRGKVLTRLPPSDRRNRNAQILRDRFEGDPVLAPPDSERDGKTRPKITMNRRLFRCTVGLRPHAWVRSGFLSLPGQALAPFASKISAANSRCHVSLHQLPASLTIRPSPSVSPPTTKNRFAAAFALPAADRHPTSRTPPPRNFTGSKDTLMG
jgi:hypothetical protein